MVMLIHQASSDVILSARIPVVFSTIEKPTPLTMDIIQYETGSSQ